MMTSCSLFVWSDQISRSARQGPTVVLLLLIRHRDSRLRGERKQFLWPHMAHGHMGTWIELKVCTDCTALPHLSFSIPSVTLRTPFLPPPSPSPHHPFIILLFYYFIYLFRYEDSITRVPEMEDNKNNHPPPKTRRAQVANACMKCRDAKLKVSIHSFFFLFFFFSFLFTNTNNTIQYKTKGEKK